MALNLNTAPYYDDFDADNSFLRILFNPGRAVQARELTQIQTILQNQLSSGANHIWKNGTPVMGAGLGLTKIDYIQLAETDTSWLGRIIVGNVSGAIGKVIQLHDDESLAYYYIKPISGNFNQVEPMQTYDTVCNGGIDNETGLCPTNTWFTPSQPEEKFGSIIGFGKGVKAIVTPGIYWISGHFVPVLEQEIFIDFLNDKPTCKVGFDITEEVIKATEDPQLLDPASGFYNQNAPGADRYSLKLNLSLESNAVTLTEYIQVMDVTAGEITTVLENTPYSVIAKAMAERTYDESGDYTTKAFMIDQLDHPTDDSKYNIKIHPGKAYVRGFENELLVPIEVTGDKGRTTNSISSSHSRAEFGPYLEVNSVADLNGIFDIVHKEKVVLFSMEGSAIVDYDGTNYSGSGASYAVQQGAEKRITHVTQYGSQYRLYLDTPDGLDSIASATYIKSSTNDLVFAKLHRPTGQTEIKGIFYPWLYETKQYTSNVVAGSVNYYTQKTFDVIMTGGQMSVPTAYPAMHWETILYVWDATNNAVINKFGDVSTGYGWFADYTDSENVVLQILNQDGTGLDGGAVNGNDLQIMSNMYISNAGHRNISSTTYTTQDVVLDADWALTLIPGIYSIESIIGPDQEDYTEDFWFYQGEFDTEFQPAVVKWSNQEVDAPPGTYQVSFTAWSYGQTNTANYIAVNSYDDGTIEYTDIPVYMNVHEPYGSYRLSDQLDFRCTEADFVTGNYLPLPQSNITVSYDYYLPHADRLTLDIDGSFHIRTGFSSEGAQLPSERETEMTLYTFYVPPYTYDVRNISASYVDNKGFSMKDLRDLEERVGSLEYYTSLNLLETSTDALQVIDEFGMERYKNGMFVDSFVDHGFGDISNLAYFVSIYPEAGICTTPFTMDGLDMILNPAKTTGLVQNDRTMTLQWTVEEGFIKNTVASRMLNLNPFAKLSFLGFMEIRPESDSWFEVTYAPDVIVENGNNNNVRQQIEAYGTQTRWNVWKTTWTGWSNVGARRNQVRGATETRWKGRSTNISAGIRGVDVTAFDGRTAANGHTNILGHSLNQIFNQGWMGSNTWLGGNPFARPAHTFTMWKETKTTNSTWDQSQTRKSTSVRTGTKTWLESRDTRRQIGDKQIDSSSLPFMRSRDIVITGYALRPGTQMHFKFDNVDVDAYCKPNGGSLGDAIYTDARGRLENITFVIPSDNTRIATSGLSFHTGTKLLEARDSWVNADTEDDEMTSSCSAFFTSQGILNTRQKTIMSTLSVVKMSEALTQRKTGTQNRTVKVGGGGGNWVRGATKTIKEYYDPVAESFMVNSDGGMFIDSIDLYFGTKETETGTPVRLEIREMDAGYPTTDAMPGGISVLQPEDVIISADGSANTRFTFADPLYCMTDTEYCMVVISDSLDYNLWISELADKDITTGSFIGKQPFLGSLFTSQNNSTWTAEQTRDLKFKLNRCQFINSGNVQFDIKEGAFEGIKEVTGLTTNFAPMLLPGTDCIYTAHINSGTDPEVPDFVLEDDEDVQLDKQVTIDSTHTIASGYEYTPISITGELGTSNPNITPVFNAERMITMIRNNVVHDNAIEELHRKGVYVSKSINLANGADDLVMYLAVQEVAQTYVKVYYDTGTVIPRYVDIEPWSNTVAYGDYDINNFEQDYAVTYKSSPEIMITAGLGSQTSWNGTIGDFASSVYVDGDDDVSNLTRGYLTDISNMKQINNLSYISKYDLDGVGRDDGTNLVDRAVGDIWFGTENNDQDKKFYRKIVLIDGTDAVEEVPVLRIISSVDDTHPDWNGGGANALGVIELEAITWREMMDSGTAATTNNEVNSYIHTENEFMEHTFKPLKKITKEFNTFRIKIQLHTTDPAYMPAVRELRVLAVT